MVCRNSALRTGLGKNRSKPAANAALASSADDADDNNNAAVRVAEVNALGDLAAAHGEQDRAVAPRVLASQRRKQCIERRGER